ncbi:aromatic ring-hydroxylating oxygenase subunit alpha [Alteromonas facilis]|uniref:aromatic ring-hydroxylating oxygenase subunit alpha n=1 Tax=Alteromonas facilis TaxID=2048004 RepID=UPI000C295757|nr:SRPBCC family protein [Alteromonas facilis]
MNIHPAINSYFDPSVSAQEIECVFKKGVTYAGHELMVPEKFGYHVLPHFNERYVLFNQGNQYDLISNVCLHRQARLLEGSGRTRNIVCKLHCWGYDNQGQLKGAPHFTPPPKGQLKKETLHNWHGLLFRGRVPNMDLAKLGLDQYIDFNGYFYAGSETTHYQFNWKTFIEIYLENYHVFSMHPGLRQYVKPNNLEWAFGEDYSVQKVGLGEDLLKATTPHYREFQDALMARYGNVLPKYGAIWCFIYPNIMIEWYPEVLVVSTIYPQGPRQCTNHVEFYYPFVTYQKAPSYFETEKKAYMETAIEDEQACLLLEKGRESLYLVGENEHGPIEPFLEAGVAHFYEFLINSNA